MLGKREDYDQTAHRLRSTAPGTAWEDVPADFVCPVCGLDKDAFEVEE
ncbi:MAG: rubredoxin [Clostridia bacterium]|nr:rubredoxin [Clostridia bacterium]